MKLARISFLMMILGFAASANAMHSIARRLGAPRAQVRISSLPMRLCSNKPSLQSPLKEGAKKGPWDLTLKEELQLAGYFWLGYYSTMAGLCSSALLARELVRDYRDISKEDKNIFQVF
jgi:hypothetical protein